MSDKILKDFYKESKELINELIEQLGVCEEDFSQVKGLETYSQKVDRIMGSAKTLSLQMGEQKELMSKIGDYSALCKTVAYKASQIKNNENFYNVCVALLFDATEMLGSLIESAHAGSKESSIKSLFSQTFIDRLKWISEQFGAEYSSSISVHKRTSKMSQPEIDDLLKKLGLD